MPENLPRGAGPLRPRVDRLLRWGPPIAWMGLIFVSSSDLGSETHSAQFVLPILEFFLHGLSPETHALLHDLIRKLGHVTEYAVLSILWARALAGPGRRWRARHIAGSLAIAILWAMGDEGHQALVPSRSASVLDVGIDTIGALAGQILGGLWTQRPRSAAVAGPGRSSAVRQ